ncbi:anhydro-N-acetylmuramic acid kinase [Glaciimonas immobilis]|uniref:Anhydro-N-acetylmuramic acid kinase n=1 Tax=Glaciimonas immobilis TaxID=728004 RepID=A0A840RSF8_9BURK|nr:anhydro-N-acetylmuramic acid kinase [Glaciimonas immobilis]KAF3999655.1 anhydro-N-acetylmuramic acid kinase [Glaciimonas immobilis]MBB5200092.1 anhydro-N-acetylmuramic acid kinase [Glaciimonas immobilis]
MTTQNVNTPFFIGLMSGTSLDGIDGVIASFSSDAMGHNPIATLASAYVPFSAALRRELMALQQAGENEIERESLVAHTLATHCAACVERLLADTGYRANQIRAIGVHGQTIRHRPELGFTRQTNNPALLAELTGIDVIADFRSRDIAAGGQGAPLVPAFHQAVFASPAETRVVVNIGGIANISVLRPQINGAVSDADIGFDTGPGNVLMDLWVKVNQGQDYDANGIWGASGKVIPQLLKACLDEPYFALPPPKSTGRDLFHEAWLAEKLALFPQFAPADVQATLTALTASTIADAIVRYAADVSTVVVCGGGAYNAHLMQALGQALSRGGVSASVASTDTLGIAPNHVEALAFAWLAQRFDLRLPGNLPAVTGAAGPRILGALYPA